MFSLLWGMPELADLGCLFWKIGGKNPTSRLKDKAVHNTQKAELSEILVMTETARPVLTPVEVEAG